MFLIGYILSVNDPLVSVVIPCYNCQETIDRAVTSLTKQKYKNIEIIIVNDGSTDQSAKVLERLQSNNEKIKVYSLNQNSGTLYARSYGINLTTGFFITCLDSDDELINNIVSLTVKKALSQDYDTIVFMKQNYNASTGKKTPHPIFFNNGFPERYMFSRAIHGKLYKRDLLIEAMEDLGWDNIHRKTVYFEDYLIGQIINKHSKKYFILNETFGYMYYLSDTQVTAHKKWEQFIGDFVHVFNSLKDKITDSYIWSYMHNHVREKFYQFANEFKESYQVELGQQKLCYILREFRKSAVLSIAEVNKYNGDLPSLGYKKCRTKENKDEV